MEKKEAIEVLQEEHDWVQEPCYVIKAIEMAIDALKMSETGKPPAHIDREAWKPCIKCNGKCYFCKFNETSKCRKCKNHDSYSPMFNFCPNCGRPLTEEAWAELEKRLRGFLE